MKYLILANHYNTLRIFRRELLQRLGREHHIVISIPPCEESYKAILESYGPHINIVFTNMSRRGMNPIADFQLFREYKRLIRDFAPDKVISYTVKCNIYGSFAAKSFNIPHYPNVTGLGSPIENGGFLGTVVKTLYKVSLNRANAIFFENIGDRDKLVEAGVVRKKQTVVMPGAGVNVLEFNYEDYPSATSPVRFLFIGRIMQEKGVDELFQAIRLLKNDGMDFIFDFIGWYEESYENQVRELQTEGLIQFHGFQDDVRPFIRACHCSVLPSWHEGMSNTLLESAAMGRPLITTHVHGCMEAVKDGITGFLVPPRNEKELFAAMKRFCNMTHEQRHNMGICGRTHVSKHFDKKNVVEKTCQVLMSS